MYVYCETRIQTAQMKFIHRVDEYTHTDRQRNIYMRKKLNIRIQSYVAALTKNGTLLTAKQTQQYHRQGNRSLRRPKERWSEQF